MQAAHVQRPARQDDTERRERRGYRSLAGRAEARHEERDEMELVAQGVVLEPGATRLRASVRTSQAPVHQYDRMSLGIQ